MRTLRPRLPGDKSLSHRVLIMAAMASGTTRVSGLSKSDDVVSTRNALVELGITIEDQGREVLVTGARHWRKSEKAIDCSNSGTTARHLLALLSCEGFRSEIVGDTSLSRRPMKRIVNPLREAGAEIELTNNEYLPAKILSAIQKNIVHELSVASGQVKSALLLAGAKAGVEVELTGKLQGRDHTERLIPYFGGSIEVKSERVYLPKQNVWHAVEYDIPSDPSAAAFWVTLACLKKNTQVEIENVLLNPGRTGFLQHLASMNGHVEFGVTNEAPEKTGWIKSCTSHELRGIAVHDITSCIDEIPLLALCATQAVGETRIENASELKYKESNRLRATAEILNRLGASVEVTDDGLRIIGPTPLQSAEVETYGDHRLLMMSMVAARAFDLNLSGINPNEAKVSDPYFVSEMRGVM